MRSPKTRGRMLNADISDSKGFAALSPEAAVLFCMLIPHYDAHGKMNGDPGYVKAVVCPRISYLTPKVIDRSLGEISTNTNVKWFVHDSRFYIHSTKFLIEHQNLNLSRLGADRLPNYSGAGPELVSPEVEVEVEVEVERSTKPRNRACAPFSLPSSIPAEAWDDFEKHRTRMRKPMTDRARQLIVKELAKIGGDPVALIEQSIRKGWQDVFPIRDNGAGLPQPGGKVFHTPAPVDRCECGKKAIVRVGGRWRCRGCSDAAEAAESGNPFKGVLQ